MKMKEVSIAADGGSSSRGFSQEMPEDHIHITPDFRSETDRLRSSPTRSSEELPASPFIGPVSPFGPPLAPEMDLVGKAPAQKAPVKDRPAVPDKANPPVPQEAPRAPQGTPPAPQETPAAQNPADCSASPIYLQIMQKAHDNMYEPDRLGDFEALKSKYNCQIKTPDDAVKYAGEALSITGDPYNSVFDKQQSERRSNDAKGVFVGFGFNFAPKHDVDGRKGAGLPSPLKVTGIMGGSPVEKSGAVKPGDFIVAVGETSLKGKTYDEAFALVRADNPKEFTLNRDGQEIKVSLTPGDIPIPAVTDKRLDGNIAYIEFKTFGQTDSATQLKKSIENNLTADAYIIDLRHNPGGFFEESIKAASLFVKDGTVVTVRERVPPAQIAASGNVTVTPPVDGTVDGGARSDAVSRSQLEDPAPVGPSQPNYRRVSYNLTPTNLNKVFTDEATKQQTTSVVERFPDLVDKPTVILVDVESASSSEVFTGALKDHGDAVVIGTRTYGKGIGQMNFYDMPHGSTLRVTNFHYFNPSGHWPGDANRNRIGIMPDHLVVNPAGVVRGSDHDQQLAAGIAQLNKMLGRAPTLDAPAPPNPASVPNAPAGPR